MNITATPPVTNANQSSQPSLSSNMNASFPVSTTNNFMTTLPNLNGQNGGIFNSNSHNNASSSSSFNNNNVNMPMSSSSPPLPSSPSQIPVSLSPFNISSPGKF